MAQFTYTFHSTTKTGIPVFVNHQAAGLVAVTARVELVDPSVVELVGGPEAPRYAVLLDRTFLRLRAPAFNALVGHEEAHVLNGDLDHPEGSLPVEGGILVVPEFELRADAHGANVAGGAKHMARVLKFVKAVFIGQLVASWITRKMTWKEVRGHAANLRRELAPRLAALKAMK